MLTPAKKGKGLLLTQKKFFQHDFIKIIFPKAKWFQSSLMIIPFLLVYFFGKAQSPSLIESKTKLGKVQCLLQRIEECKAVDDKYGLLKTLSDLSSIYMTFDSEKALTITQQLLEVEQELGLKKDMIVTHHKLGQIYNLKKEYSKATECFSKSIEIADQLGSKPSPYIHSEISDAYFHNGQFKKAFDHKVLFYKMKDSILSKEQEAHTQELLIQYETEKKERQIELLKKDQELKRIEHNQRAIEYNKKILEKSLGEQASRNKLLQRNREMALLKKNQELKKIKIEHKQNEVEGQKILTWLTVGGAVIVCASVVILLIVYRQKVRQKELLVFKMEAVNKQKTLELIKTFEIQAIRATIVGQEKEKRRIAGELHDGIGGALAGIKMRVASLTNSCEHNPILEHVIERIDQVYCEVRTLSHHLTPPEMINYSFIDFIRKYLKEITHSTSLEIDYFLHNEDEFNALADDLKVEIYRIIQELINNVIKHSAADFVEVQLAKVSENISLIVEDNGKGFTRTAAKFGTGLTNISNRLKILQGEMQVDSAPIRGTIVTVEIPTTAKSEELKETVLYEN